jgi:hypothetical protein
MAKGSKTGGRERGTPNRATAAKAAAVAASGLTPLDFEIAMMRRYAAKAELLEKIADDETASRKERAEAGKMARECLQIAMDAARNAAPFVHPKLTAITPPEPEPQQKSANLELIVQFESADPSLRPKDCR